jgi:hypothetical protein
MWTASANRPRNPKTMAIIWDAVAASFRHRRIVTGD